MLILPQMGEFLVQHNLGTVGATAVGTNVTTGASTTTKGTPAELIASTDFETYFVEVFATDYGASAVASGGCMDILVGSATEEILIPDLLFGNCGGVAANLMKRWMFPLYIPAGTRIACQAAGERNNQIFNVGICLYGGNGLPPFKTGSKVTTYGIGTIPAAVAVTPGASGAEGSWTEITASTSEDHHALYPSLHIPGDTAFVSRVYFLDIGIGAATEEEIAQSYIYVATAAEIISGPTFKTLPCFKNIPAGSRLTARLSTDSTALDTPQVAIHAVS